MECSEVLIDAVCFNWKNCTRGVGNEVASTEGNGSNLEGKSRYFASDREYKSVLMGRRGTRLLCGML